MRRLTALATLTVVLAAGVVYLHDPPWAGRITSGMRDWEVDPAGVRFRWTNGHASFFVPASAPAVGLRIRGAFPGRLGASVVVHVAIDDRPATDIVLADPTVWQSALIPLPRRGSGRRYRRIDLRVDRTVGQYNLGVQVGELYFPDLAADFALPAFALRRSAQMRFMRSE
jgi:hypothetical protein